MYKVLSGLFIVFLLSPVLTACSSPNTVSPTPADNPAPTGDLAQADTNFTGMLELVPLSFMEEQDFWFCNWGKAKNVLGAGDVSSIQEAASLPEEERQALQKASADVIPTSWKYLELAPVVGFDGMMVDQQVFVDIIPLRIPGCYRHPVFRR